MAMLTINDLRMSRALDYQAMSSVKGAGGAPWVLMHGHRQRVGNAYGMPGEAA